MSNDAPKSQAEAGGDVTRILERVEKGDSNAILQNEPLVVNDALQGDRFADNPVVIGDPKVRFYAGIRLHAADGARVGAFCIVDSKPRSLSAAQLGMLKDIARLIEEELEPRAVAKVG